MIDSAWDQNGEIEKVISSFPELSDTTVVNMLDINECSEFLTANQVEQQFEKLEIEQKMNTFECYYEDYNTYLGKPKAQSPVLKPFLAAQQINDYYSTYSFPDGSLFDSNFDAPTPQYSAPLPALCDMTNKVEKVGKARRQKYGQRQEENENEDQNQFVMKVKRHRIRLGFTQADVGISLGALYDRNFSQTTVCRSVFHF